MAMPTIVAGTSNSGITSAVTYTLPTHQADDVLFLVVESQQTAGVTAPSGWTDVTGSPRAQGTNVLAVNVFWKRATSSAETNPTVAAASNHQVGNTFRVRGAVTTGSPWDFVTGSGATGATTFSATGGTTLGADRLVVLFVTGSTDTATNQFSAIAASGLTSVATVDQRLTTDGGGGGYAVATGQEVAAGATGSFTGTIAASSSWSALVLAVPGAPTLTTVAATRSTTWTTNATTAATRGTTWTVQARTTATRPTTWTTRQAVTAARASTWTTTATVGTSRATTWNVGGSLATVVATRGTTWVVRSTTAASRATSWTTRTAAVSSRATTWTTRALVTSTRASNWNVGGAGAAARVLSAVALPPRFAVRALSDRYSARPPDDRFTIRTMAPRYSAATKTRYDVRSL